MASITLPRGKPINQISLLIPKNFGLRFNILSSTVAHIISLYYQIEFYSLNLDIMKALSIIFYIAGFVLLITSCFVKSVSADWWLGAAAVVALIIGCICQFNVNRASQVRHL